MIQMDTGPIYEIPGGQTFIYSHVRTPCSFWSDRMSQASRSTEVRHSQTHSAKLK